MLRKGWRKDTSYYVIIPHLNIPAAFTPTNVFITSLIAHFKKQLRVYSCGIHEVKHFYEFQMFSVHPTTE